LAPRLQHGRQRVTLALIVGKVCLTVAAALQSKATGIPEGTSGGCMTNMELLVGATLVVWVVGTFAAIAFIGGRE
jgi:hypothetical protein